MAKKGWLTDKSQKLLTIGKPSRKKKSKLFTLGGKTRKKRGRYFSL